MNPTVSSSEKKAETSALIRICLRELTLLCIGGVGYYALEVVFRGFSHWSMAICGGLCLSAIYHLNQRMLRRSICLRALIGSAIITAVELICGILVNLVFDLNVWDYSHLPLNLWGQICLPFSLLWAALCLPVCAVCSLIQRRRRGA